MMKPLNIYGSAKWTDNIEEGEFECNGATYSMQKKQVIYDSFNLNGFHAYC